MHKQVLPSFWVLVGVGKGKEVDLNQSISPGKNNLVTKLQIQRKAITDL